MVSELFCAAAGTKISARILNDFAFYIEKSWYFALVPGERVEYVYVCMYVFM